ncbi:MAG: hypothetical protein HY741_00580 [Chloroflexi bacterium]|nr:hypothetical protein [Chloroflexota bacterium]
MKRNHIRFTGARWVAFGFAAVAFFAMLLSAAPVVAAGISANPTYGNFDTTYTFQANGFQRNEIVDTWVGLPNLSAVNTGALRADDAGRVSWSFKPKTSQGGGEYIAVANGRVSGRVSAKFNVVAPPQDKPSNPAKTTQVVTIAPVSERTVQFSGRSYQAGELVNTWYRAPNGVVTGYRDFYADAWGNLAFNFTVPSNWMYGGYQLVGRGTRSGTTDYITFSFFRTVSDVRANNPITKPAPYFDFWQGGFSSGEQVSIWVGLPNGATQAAAIVNATGGGNVYYRVNILPSWQYGGYVVAAYGWKSHVTKWQRFSYFGTVERLYP